MQEGHWSWVLEREQETKMGRGTVFWVEGRQKSKERTVRHHVTLGSASSWVSGP